MADIPSKTPPGTDLLMQQSKSTASDRAKRINSLHKHVDKIVVEQNRKNLQISKDTDTLSKQKERLRRELDYARSDISNELAQDYNKVVKGLGSTIQQMSIGMKNISVSTAQATTNAISQYGKAIGQDININKTNTVAMALAKATPLFGYFAAKFMETDVFQGAARKIRDKIGSAMVSGLSAAGRKISGLFQRDTPREKMGKRQREIGALSSEVAALKKEIQGKPPALQTGGYVKKGGVVQVHAAEVIAPVDTLVKEITSSIAMQQEKDRRSFIRTFVKEYKGAKLDDKTQNWQDRMLKAILELKISFIGTTSRLRIAWQRTLLENPAFRGMLMFAEGFKLVLGAPIKWLFGARGGYLSDVKKATATDNVFLKVANLLGVLYTTAMPKLDAIAKYTRVSATVAAGYEPTAPIMDKYTMFQKVKGFLKSRKKGKGLGVEGLKSKGFDTILKMAGVSDDEIGEFHKSGGFKGMFGLGKEAAESAKGGLGKGKEAAEKGYEEVKGMVSDIRKLREMKTDQEEREGPHSPSMAERIKDMAETGKKQYVDVKKRGGEQLKEITKSRKAQELQNSFLGRMAKRLKKLGGKMWQFAMFAFSMFQSIVSGGVRMIGWILGPILTQLGIRGLFKKGGKGFVSHAGKGAKAAKGQAGKAGKFASQTGRVAKTAGPKAAGKFGAKGVGAALKGGAKWVGRLGLNVGKAAGRAFVPLGAAIGIAEGGWDAVSIMRNPQGFVGGVITRGLSAFLGGKGSGASGALSGALKGGALGAAATAWLGPGALIGGAIGAAAGGILGFIGGKNISKAIDFVVKPVKKLASAVWRIITFPVKLVGQVVKFFKRYLTETETGKKIWKQVKFWAPKIMFPPLMMIWAAKKAFGMFKTAVGKLWDKVKDTWFGKGVTAIWDTMMIAVNKAKEVASMVGDALGRVWDDVKSGFMSVVGMFQAIPQAIRDMHNWIVDKITGIPFIGRFIKGIKKFVADVESGTLADKGIKAVKTAEKKKTLDKYYSNIKEGEAGSKTNRYRTVDRLRGESQKEHRQRTKMVMNIALSTLGASGGSWTNGTLTRAKIKDVWYDVVIGGDGQLKELNLSTDQTGTELGKKLGQEEASRRSFDHSSRNAQTGALTDKMGKTGEATVNATNVSSSNVVSSVNNISHSQPRSGNNWSRGFGSGNGYASDVERCNIS